MTTITVSNSASLASALKAAKGGDTILLAPGDYGKISLAHLGFSSQVTLKSADNVNRAILAGATISNSSNIRLDGIDVRFTPTETSYAWSSAIDIKKSSNITIANSRMRGGVAVNGVPIDALKLDASSNVLGLPAGRAVTVTGSSNISFTGNDIGVFHKGIVLSSVDGITISKSRIHDLRSTPISGGNVSNLTVTDNHLHDSTPWRFSQGGDHGDFIHIWTSTTQTSASANYTIARNFIDQGTGTALLGIYLDDNDNKMGFNNVRITDNVIFNDDGQGIRIENGHGVTVTDNTLIHSRTTAKEAPAVIFTKGTDGIVFTRNILTGAPSTTLEPAANGNLYLQRVDANAANHYGRVFVNALTVGATLSDLQILPTSPIAGKGYGSDLSIFVRPVARPVASFASSAGDANHREISFDGTLSFVPAIGGATGKATYQWDFGDGTTATGAKQNHVYARTGSYSVSLAVTDQFGNVSTSRRDIRVIDECLLRIDFSPSGVSENSTYGSPLRGSTSAAHVVETERGDAYQLTGTNWFEADEVTAPQLFNRDRFTLSFDLQRNSATTGTGSLMRIHASWSVSLTTKGEIEFTMTNQSGTSHKVTSSGAGITDTAMHRIDVSFDAPQGKALIYVDGRQVGQGAVSGSTRMIASWGFAVGNPFGSSAQAKIGAISLVDQVRSADYIAAASTPLQASSASPMSLVLAAPTLADMLAAPATQASQSDPFQAPSTASASLSLASLASLSSWTTSLAASRLV